MKSYILRKYGLPVMLLIGLSYLVSIISSCRGGGSGSSPATSAPNIVVQDPANRIVSFGTTTLNNTIDKTITIANSGTNDLTINAVVVSAPFSIPSDSCSGQIVASTASCVFTVRFIARGGGTVTKSLFVQSNDPDEPSVSVTLSGTSNNVMFVTSVTGMGNLSAWPDAGGKTGLAASDAICQARAAVVGLTGTYKAWLSDDSDDAYCRLQGVSGKMSTTCGGNNPAEKAGPWVRTDGYPFAENIDQMLTMTGKVYTPARYDEFGNAVATGTFYFTATSDDGALFSSLPSPCSNWTTTTGSTLIGNADRTTAYWTWYAGGANCGTNYPLLCFQTGAGPALPSMPSTGKKVFLTSVSGNGNLGSWADAGGKTGIAAGDAICQARALASSLTGTYRTWLSDSGTNAINQITEGVRIRLDGVKIADSKADLTDGTLFAPINLTETGVYLGKPNAWTGTNDSGTISIDTCNNWTDGSALVNGVRGLAVDAGAPWSELGSFTCDRPDLHLYCFEE